MCQVNFDHEERRLFVSITQLRFASTAPLAREIAAYQKHRMKRLRRLGTDRVRGAFRA
jgi:hypothetical protein